MIRVAARLCSSKVPFGRLDVGLEEKQGLVNGVFDKVSSKYDVMNDVMSLGVHRYWKNYFVHGLGRLGNQGVYNALSTPFRVLDVAGGTGDIAFRILQENSGRGIQLTVTDINGNMIEEGRRKAPTVHPNDRLQFKIADAQKLPFEDGTFDVYTIAFGIRNVPDIPLALREAHRVLKRGGRISILQFSRVNNPILRSLYEAYSKFVIPNAGQAIAGDYASYQYLVESIERFHSQESLLGLVRGAGFGAASYLNLSDGVVAIHNGFKF